MPGLLHEGIVVICEHGGQAQPMTINPRICVNGQPIVVQTAAYTVAGCPNPVPPGPCITALWVTAAVRVKADGIPVLLQNSQAECIPTGTGVNIIPIPTRVQGQ